jgi:RNA polymerase sigma-70 factor (ECF subfamily)
VRHRKGAVILDHALHLDRQRQQGILPVSAGVTRTESLRGDAANAEGKELYEFFAQQYDEYLPRVLNYVRLRVSDQDTAQDLTAQCFERALTRLHTLRDRGAFGGWLFSIARTTVAGYYRRRKTLLPLESVADRPSPELPVEGQLVHGQEVEALRLALALLSEREQEIIRLRFVAGLTNRAIGKMMGLREGNVAVILFRALRKLRRTLAEPETPDG